MKSVVIIGCHCAPKKCHADILAQYVNAEIAEWSNARIS